MIEDKISKYIDPTKDMSFIWEDEMKEAVGKFNIGFEEMVKFYNEASPQEIKKMEKIVKNNDWQKFKALIKSVLGIQLQ